GRPLAGEMFALVHDRLGDLRMGVEPRVQHELRRELVQHYVADTIDGQVRAKTGDRHGSPHLGRWDRPGRAKIRVIRISLSWNFTHRWFIPRRGNDHGASVNFSCKSLLAEALRRFNK